MRSPGANVIRWGYKPVLHALLVLPAMSLLVGLVTNNLGANPVETITHETGEWGLRILLLSLAVTPAARLTHSGWFIQFRRLIGLYSFFYVLMHFLTYLVLDLSLDFGFLLEDVLERQYITVGFAAFVILLSLALTSPIAVRRWMAKSWNSLHRLVYLAGALGVLHFLWSTRADDTEPFIYGAVFCMLMGYRLKHAMRRKNHRAATATTARASRV